MSLRARRWARRGSPWLPPWWLAGLLTVGLAGSTGCGDEEPAAVTAAKAFTRAARSGNVEQVLALVDAQTVARVGQAAERASDQVGGRRVIEPVEMLQVVDVDPRFQIASAELSQGDDQQAVVRIEGADGTSHTLELVNEQGSWRVRLPLPRGPMGQP